MPSGPGAEGGKNIIILESSDTVTCTKSYVMGSLDVPLGKTDVRCRSKPFPMNSKEADISGGERTINAVFAQ